MARFGKGDLLSGTALADGSFVQMVQLASASGTSSPAGTSTDPTYSHVDGNVANGAADSGNPVKVGGLASAGIPSAVSAGQRVAGWYSLNGAAVVSLGAATAVASGFASNTLISASDAGGTARSLVTAPTVFDGANLALQAGDAKGVYLALAAGATTFRQSYYSGKSRITSTATGGSPTNAKTTAAVMGGFVGLCGATATYLQIYDKASAPVIGTDTPVLIFPCPANAAFSSPSAWAGTYFVNGLAYAFTTDAAGTTAAAAAAVTSFSLTYA